MKSWRQGEEQEQRGCKSEDAKIILQMRAKEAGTEVRGKKKVISLCQWQTSERIKNKQEKRRPCWSLHQHRPDLATGERGGRTEVVGTSHHLHRSNLHHLQEEGTDQARHSVNSCSFAADWQNANGTRQNCNTQFHIPPLLVILSPRGRTWEQTFSFGTAEKNCSYLSVRQLWNTWQPLLFYYSCSGHVFGHLIYHPTCFWLTAGKSDEFLDLKRLCYQGCLQSKICFSSVN